MRRRWWGIWFAFIGALVLIEIGVVTGLLIFDPVTNFYFVIVAIVVIGILAIVGAVFIGIFLTQRVFTSQEFTPFEKEMLAMREDVKALVAKVDELDARNPANLKDREEESP